MALLRPTRALFDFFSPSLSICHKKRRNRTSEYKFSYFSPSRDRFDTVCRLLILKLNYPGISITRHIFVRSKVGSKSQIKFLRCETKCDRTFAGRWRFKFQCKMCLSVFSYKIHKLWIMTDHRSLWVYLKTFLSNENEIGKTRLANRSISGFLIKLATAYSTTAANTYAIHNDI